jgi:hypothetical protein
MAPVAQFNLFVIPVVVLPEPGLTVAVPFVFNVIVNFVSVLAVLPGSELNPRLSVRKQIRSVSGSKQEQGVIAEISLPTRGISLGTT